MEEIEPLVRKLRYEYDHWDDAIHGYREREKLEWNEANTQILNRVRALAFNITGLPTSIIKHIHVLDLHENGYIKPHVDSVKFCGNTIAGSMRF